MIDQYFTKIHELLETIQQNQMWTLQQVAEKTARALQKDGIIQLFGAGHSHLFGEEVFYRAGGLVPIKPILEEDLMLHRGAVRSSQFERSNEYAAAFVQTLDIQPNDVLFVSSTSGRNPVPIEVAQYAKDKGAFVVAMTSLSYSQSQESRHHSGRRLFEVADVTIDNLSVKGDAVLNHDKVKVPFAPTSTVIGTCVINAIMAETVQFLAEWGVEPPVLLSGNIDGADDHNEKLIDRYRNRIPML
ncbi:hypothetical protein CR194_17915 [Salipaludibacillus keqinensis]|uniref:UPF0309 protein CR194_17915 n=1 Tax=Salipaludibacillus keqinensis TaxID=2045207 RepID=A0A323T9K6_9BACI|nr:SIS domain-containing protein [Salipaludibacillus keqinensis]PYZ92069.1 hypothetical protein CR194_17915 [Salipaludibacillus keqinensis]